MLDACNTRTPSPTTEAGPCGPASAVEASAPANPRSVDAAPSGATTAFDPLPGSVHGRALTRLRNLFGVTARKGAWSLGDQIVVCGTGFVTTVAVGRLCGPEELGYYSLGMTLVLLIISAQHSLVSLPYTIYGNRLGGEERALYAGSVLVQYVLVAVLAMTCLAALAWPFSLGFGPAGLTPVIGVLAATIPFVLLRQLGRRMAFAHLNVTTALLLDCLVGVLQVGGLAAVAVAGLLSASTAYTVTGVACGIGGFAWLAFERARFRIGWRSVSSAARRNFALGRWVLADQLTLTLRQASVLWLLAFMLGEVATGTLQACLTIIAFSRPFMLGLENVLAPRIARARTAAQGSELRRVVRKVTLLVGVAMGAFCGAVAVFGGQLVQLLYGSGYAGTALAVAVAALATLVSAVGHPSSLGLLALERANWCFGIRVVALSVTVVTAVCLIEPLGVAGAACGLLAGSLSAGLGMILAFRVLAAAEDPRRTSS